MPVVTEIWKVSQAKTADLLVISIHEILHDSAHELGIDPGLQKDGVEADLQKLLAAQIELLGDGHTLVRREYMTAIGPVDILARDPDGGAVARGDQKAGGHRRGRAAHAVSRADEPRPAPRTRAGRVRGPGDQAAGAHLSPRTRGIRCLLLDYDAMRGLDDSHSRLF